MRHLGSCSRFAHPDDTELIKYVRHGGRKHLRVSGLCSKLRSTSLPLRLYDLAMMVCAGATAVAGYPLAMSTLESAVVPFCRAPEDALVAPVPTSAAGAAAARTCGSS